MTIGGNSMADVWKRYVKFVLDGEAGVDEGVEMRERFWVALRFDPEADFNTAHPMMDLSQQQQYVEKLLSVEIDTALGGSYGYRLQRSYDVDQISGIVSKLISKPESKAACANLLHPLQSRIEQDAGMKRTACLTNVQAILRNKRLSLTAHFRSQNAWNSHGNFKALHILHENLLTKVRERAECEQSAEV